MLRQFNLCFSSPSWYTYFKMVLVVTSTLKMSWGSTLEYYLSVRSVWTNIGLIIMYTTFWMQCSEGSKYPKTVFSKPLPSWISRFSKNRPLADSFIESRCPSACLRVCLSLGGNHTSQWIRDLWSKGISLILAYL